MKQTQCDMVISYIKDYGSITTYEAFKELGITRLASRICDLKKLGYDFDTQIITKKNRYGEPVSFKKYSLAKGA